MTSKDTDLLRVLIFQKDGIYIAQCLEKDIGTQGKDMNELLSRLLSTVLAEVPYMERIGKAPQKFFDMWDDGEVLPHNNPFASYPIDTRMAV